MEVGRETNQPPSVVLTFVWHHRADSERPDVIGVIAATVQKDLHFQAFRGEEPVGDRAVITVGSGDVYVMCEHAAGHTWREDRKRGGVHYRHAAGCVGGNAHTPTKAALLGQFQQANVRNRAYK